MVNAHGCKPVSCCVMHLTSRRVPVDSHVFQWFVVFARTQLLQKCPQPHSPQSIVAIQCGF